MYRALFFSLVLCGCGEGLIEAEERAAIEEGADPTEPTPLEGAKPDDPSAPPSQEHPEQPPVEVPPEQEPPPAEEEPAPAESGVPCEVQRILTEACANCHDAMPRFGAPMPMHDMGALHALAPSDRAKKVYELILPRVEHQTSPMPPPPNALLEASQIETLRSWIDEGAPAGTVCGEEVPEQMPMESPNEPMPDPSAECTFDLELRAHGARAAGDETPFRVPLQQDHYECFYFHMPWSGDAHGLSFSPLIDDERVLHHWLLYVQEGANVQDGDHEGCLGRHDNASLVAGWAPGGQPYILPDEVGLHLPSGQSHVFVLEIHYNNSGNHNDALDKSGVHVCATEDLRPETAGMQWLGTENLLMVAPGEHERSGTCNPRLDEPVTIVSSSPHMHLEGVHMKTEILRANGQRETLIDTPFDFNNQIIYDTPAVIHPGDRLETTCTFNHPGGFTTFGPGTNDEMCYNFIVAYPKDRLSTGGSFTNAENACLR